MKKLLILLALLLVFFCGCSANTQTDDDNSFTLATFSYEADYANLTNNPGVETSGFKNFKESDISGVEQLIELARDECTIDFEIITTSYDSESEIYKFTFFTENPDSECKDIQDIYMSKDGITKMIVTSQSK